MCGINARARPTTSEGWSHICPGAYKPRSSTKLLSPLVKNLIAPVPVSWWSFITRWTIGMSRPVTLKTKISPTRIGSDTSFVKKSLFLYAPPPHTHTSSFWMQGFEPYSNVSVCIVCAGTRHMQGDAKGALWTLPTDPANLQTNCEHKYQVRCTAVHWRHAPARRAKEKVRSSSALSRWVLGMLLCVRVV